MLASAAESRLPLSASALAGRPRAALGALLRTLTDSLAEFLPVAVDAFERELIELATESESAPERERCRDTLLRLGDAAELLRIELAALIEDALARLDTLPPAKGIGADDPDERAALEAIATRVRNAAGPELAMMCERLGTLAGVSFDDYCAPLGPWRLCEYVRLAASALELDAETRLLLYHAIERVWMAQLPELYADVDALLARALSMLRIPKLEVREVEAREIEPADGFDWSGFDRPLTGWPVVGLPHAKLADADDTADADLDIELRRRLATLAAAGPVRAEARGHAANLVDIDRALAAIQKRPVQPLMMGGRLVPRSIAHLRQDLLIQLRELDAEGRPAKLADAESETVELVARLFDALLAEKPPTHAAHAILARLQVPVLRAALIDPGFFTRRAHPARQLLGAIAEAATEWLGDEQEDRPVAEALEALAARAPVEYKGAVEAFTRIADDYATTQAAQARKTQLAERRNIEAARGREKLDLARRDAVLAIGQRVAAGRPTALVRAVLEEGWTKVLAMTLMREPAGSPGHLSRLAVAERMIEALGPGREPIGYEEETFLRREIEIGLGKVGYHAGDAQLIVERLLDDDEHAHADGAVALRAAPLGGATKGDAAGEATPAPSTATGAPIEPRVARVRDRVLALPPGAWIDCALTHGRVVRRKLAWTSAASGRCLVVDQRGTRIDEPALDDVARRFAEGAWRVVRERDDSVVDRALRAI